MLHFPDSLALHHHQGGVPVLTALNNLENFGYEAQIIVEPTTIPSNVNGGLGMVAVQARTEAAAIELPPQVFTFFNDEEYYE